MNIVEAMRDPQLFADAFGADSFAPWRALLGAFYGLELTEDEAKTVQAITGRESVPQSAFRELWLAVGRRGGKSYAAALVAVYEAAFRDHRAKLAPGEWATVMLLAADRQQARTLLRYVRGMFDHPMLRPMVSRETSDGLELTNRCAIEVHTASHRAVRGYTCAAVICDEIAFWQSEGVSPDAEIIAALRPSLATLDGRLVCISSPYARRGVLWETYRRYYGSKSDRVLVAQAPSRTMNPTLPQRIVDDAIKDDAARASAEYLANFRDDIATFVDGRVIAECTRRSPLELPYWSKHRYFAFADPAGGGADEFTLAIGHMDGRRCIVDVVRGLKGSPPAIVAEYADLLASYRIRRVSGDRYAGHWPRDAFRAHGIGYVVAEMHRSDLYVELLASLNSGLVELPPDEMLARQFMALERRTSRTGRDMIDHPPGGHDDRANAVAGLVIGASLNASKICVTGIGSYPST
ncbi:hypothetical protein [Tropicimonas sediminicola]|uniref:Phage terminase-like protein, large subunit, contains N-terminal HTH domain n=1 Tax=Tropicimonas sediminicola TaxID=1031541 RepID=A0A239M7J7_9RHOB|nr:hypothetical protein [Tropicimonas sediminicola]SNT38102.1 hypothetical protein SAMN05421757_11367 [Tropicimonas sediminicola]